MVDHLNNEGLEASEELNNPKRGKIWVDPSQFSVTEVFEWAEENGIKTEINPITRRRTLLMDDDQRFHFKFRFNV